MLSKMNKLFYRNSTSREENCNVPMELDSPNESKSTRYIGCSKVKLNLLLTLMNKFICYLKIYHSYLEANQIQANWENVYLFAYFSACKNRWPCQFCEEYGEGDKYRRIKAIQLHTYPKATSQNTKKVQITRQQKIREKSKIWLLKEKCISSSKRN